MKARPILFSAPMIRALLAGTKTQTRRAVKPPFGLSSIENLHATDPHLFSGRHDDPESWGWPFADDGAPMSLATWKSIICPYGTTGDLLWVREGVLFNHEPGRGESPWVYRADMDDHAEVVRTSEDCNANWKPSIHMPRTASRLTLRITDVRVQRLQEISEADARAEGLVIEKHHWSDCEYPLPDIAYRPSAHSERRWSCPVQAYQDLWESINGPGSWKANPWVWCVSFDVIKRNVDAVLKEAA